MVKPDAISAGDCVWQLQLDSPPLSLHSKCLRVVRQPLSECPEILHRMRSPDYNPKFKTEFCRDWLIDGFCSHNNGCWFAHDLTELSPSIRKSNYKSSACYRHHNGDSGCQYGMRCQFTHKLSADNMYCIYNFIVSDITLFLSTGFRKDSASLTCSTTAFLLCQRTRPKRRENSAALV